MPRVLALYYDTYVVFFLSNIEQPQNKSHSPLFIGKSENPYKLTKYQFAS